MIIRSVKLNYNFDIFLKADYTKITESAIEYSNGYKYPKSYSSQNTTIHQLWWNNDQIDFENIGNQLGIDVVSISSIKQDPGHVNPVHLDEFFLIRKKFPNRIEPRVRANIFLEDWKPGHYLHYLNTVVNIWNQGQGLLWDSEVEHSSANAGLDPKYTLQVSGFLRNSNA